MLARSEAPETRATSTLIEPFLVESERLWFAEPDELDGASEDRMGRRVSITHIPLILSLDRERTIPLEALEASDALGALEPAGRFEGEGFLLS